MMRYISLYGIQMDDFVTKIDRIIVQAKKSVDNNLMYVKSID